MTHTNFCVQSRFTDLIQEKADLKERLEELEHCCIQLSGETDTIGMFAQHKLELLELSLPRTKQFKSCYLHRLGFQSRAGCAGSSCSTSLCSQSGFYINPIYSLCFCCVPGEYIALYQSQRAILKQRHQEKEEYISRLAQDKEEMKARNLFCSPTNTVYSCRQA